MLVNVDYFNKGGLYMEYYLVIIQADNDGTFKSVIQKIACKQMPKPHFRYTKNGTIYYKAFFFFFYAKRVIDYIKVV